MRLIIEIPEDVVIQCKKHCMPVDCEMFARKIIEDIANGKPLPKGHGRLIDADAFTKEMGKRVEADILWGKNAIDAEIQARAEQAVLTFTEVVLTVKKMPTIIKADKETDHGKEIQ